LVRPYAITGGRTSSGGPVIELESQVVATAKGAEYLNRYRWEAARVIEIASHPLALIEVAVQLDVPVGVARVVISDLVKEGSLQLLDPQRAESSYADLLEKVLDGIRSL
jgi:hypothetical protein